MVQELKHYINGRWISGKGKQIKIVNPYSEEIISFFSELTKQEIDEAVNGSLHAYKNNKLTPYQKYEILSRASALLKEKENMFAELIVKEAGKPIKFALGEVKRSEQTLLVSAEEAKRITGFEVPVSAAPEVKNKLAFAWREPLGVILAISPFNFPLNLALHKVGPAIAAGNSVVLKPSSYTPQTAMKLVEVLIESGLPEGMIQLILGGGSSAGNILIQNPYISAITFTGSPQVGEYITKVAGIKKLILELGSNSSIAVMKSADLDIAVKNCALAGFAYAGQVCISLQRLFVHEKIYNDFIDKFLHELEKIGVGDPFDERNIVGPMINKTEIERVKNAVDEAINMGGKVIFQSNNLKLTVFPPTVIEFANHNSLVQVIGKEIFAPVVTIFKFKEMDELISMVNDSEFGLQAGIFTNDLNEAFSFSKNVKVGGVMVNEGCMFRTDLMPYGGVKMSGIGREGPKYSIEELTELKLMVLQL